MMIPSLVLGLFFGVPAHGAAPVAERAPVPPAVLLTEVELSSKTLQELWLMRNGIFARHGRPFKTYELNAYFRGQGYEPKKGYKETSLTSVERKNVVLLEKLEKELAKRNTSTEDGRERIALGNVLNKFQFPQFDEKQSALLSSNGFVVLPSKSKQLFHILEQNDYAGVPSLVTTDAVLQVFHEFFDAGLRRIETEHLSVILAQLCRRMVAESSALQAQSQDPIIKESARRNMAYFSVPLYFLDGKKADSIPAEVKELVLQEVQLCERHAGLDSPLIIKSDGKLKVDYSQFVPRGHYTRSDELKAYFMAMMWFGSYGLPIDDDAGLAQSLLLTYQLQNTKDGDKTLMDAWRRVYETTAFYAGVSDELGPGHYLKELPQAFAGTGWGQFHDPAQLAQMRQKLAAAAEALTKIDQARSLAFGSDKKVVLFKFMGQRYIPDSDVFTRLTSLQRPMPKALDVMAALGGEFAAKLMQEEYKDTWKDWPAYPDRLKEAQALFASLKPEDWQQSLYYGWLWTLKPLLVSKLEGPYPVFMRSEAYPAKSLQAVLASWTELRHDTILYAKQSYAAECGGSSDLRLAWIPDPPKGFVEPNAEFYGRLRDLLKRNHDGLRRRGLGGESMSGIVERLDGALAFLHSVSTKELAGLPLSNKEYEQIRRFGGLLQSLTQSIGDMGDRHHVEISDQRAALVADVHTRTTGQDEVLEEAVGDAAEIYAIVEIEGKLKLTRGAVFTHYEFALPLSQRLTDESWHAMLDSGKAPARDSWTDAFCSDTPVTLPKPAYVDEAVERNIGGESGWKTIDYDTGS